jgi:hemerythrin-like domain-containing protein
MITPEQLRRGGELGSTLDQPLDHLTACHRRIEQRLATLERAAPYLECRRDEALEAVDSALRFIDTSGVLHTRDEEDSVFPRLRPGLSPGENAFIDELEQQHQKADSLYGQLKDIVEELRSQNTPELIERYKQTVAGLCTIYRAHIAAEDETLVAIGKRVLGPEELSGIAAEMKQRRSVQG